MSLNEGSVLTLKCVLRSPARSYRGSWGFTMATFNRECRVYVASLREHSKPERTGEKRSSLLFGITTHVWGLQNSYCDSESRRSWWLLKSWTVFSVRWLTLFTRDDSQVSVLLTSPFTNAATENGHHETRHPSNVLALWSAPGNWLDVLAFGLQSCLEIFLMGLKKPTNWEKLIFKAWWVYLLAPVWKILQEEQMLGTNVHSWGQESHFKRHLSPKVVFCRETL